MSARAHEPIAVLYFIHIFFLINMCFSIDFICSSSQTSDDQVNGRSQKRGLVTRPHADLVKWQGTSIRNPLLRLPTELSALAIECFECILRYSGDLPQTADLTEVKCVYTVLMVWHIPSTLLNTPKNYLILNFLSVSCITALSQTFDTTG